MRALTYVVCVYVCLCGTQHIYTTYVHTIYVFPRVRLLYIELYSTYAQFEGIHIYIYRHKSYTLSQFICRNGIVTHEHCQNPGPEFRSHRENSAPTEDYRHSYGEPGRLRKALQKANEDKRNTSENTQNWAENKREQPRTNNDYRHPSEHNLGLQKTDKHSRIGLQKTVSAVTSAAIPQSFCSPNSWVTKADSGEIAVICVSHGRYYDKIAGFGENIGFTMPCAQHIHNVAYS